MAFSASIHRLGDAALGWLRAKVFSSRQDPTSAFNASLGTVVELPQSDAKFLFHYSRFATYPEQFRLWVDFFFERIPLPAPAVALLLGAAVFLGGLLLAFRIDFAWEYLHTPAIYVGAFGIAWVVGVIRYAAQGVHHAYRDLRPCFLIDDNTYRDFIRGWFHQLSSGKGNLLAGGVMLGLAAILVHLAFFRVDIQSMLAIKSLRPSAFPLFWYTSPHLVEKSLIILYYGLCCAMPLGTASRILIINLKFLLALRSFPVLPSPNIIRTRLRQITDLYMAVSASWFIGVALFGVVLFQNLDIFAVFLLGGIGMLGTLTFLTPQFVFRNYLTRSYRLICDWSLLALNRRLGIDLREETGKVSYAEFDPESANLNDLSNISQATTKPYLWVYDPEDFLILFGGNFISLASVYVQDAVADFVRNLWLP